MGQPPFTQAQEARLREIAREEIEASFQGVVQWLSCMKVAASPSGEVTPAVRATVRHLRAGVQATDADDLNSQLAATSAALRGVL